MEEFGFSLFGWVLWTVAMYSYAKNKTDALKQKFDWPQYRYENADNWAVSFLCIFPLTWWMEDICSMLTMLSHHLPGVSETFTWPVWKINYLGAGVLAELVYFGIEWIFNRKATLVKWVHKTDTPPAG